MPILSEIQQQARAIRREERIAMIAGMPETELHEHLKELFCRLEPDYLVEITHGVTELGKDLVLLKRDQIYSTVTAVVVKRGDILGKTLGSVDSIKQRVSTVLTSKAEGRIDEIQCQIGQALAHPAEAKTIFATLPVNQIIVVLAGRISGSARDRLKGELPPSITENIWDINLLVDFFTDKYPEVFFDGRAATFLQQKIAELESKTWLIKTDRSFSEYFVEPLLASSGMPDTIAGFSQLMTQKRLNLAYIKSCIPARKYILLVGSPGTGKSAATAKLTLDLLRTSYKSVSKAGSHTMAISVPIALTAKQLLETSSSRALIEAYCPAADTRARLSVSVLIVDAVDEVHPDSRAQVMERARTFSRELESALIITSRKIDIANTKAVGFEKLEVLPFEIGQALKLFENLNISDTSLSALKEGLRRVSSQLPIIPLSLVLLMELVEEHKEIPASITELYDRWMDSILGRDDVKKGITVLFDYLVKKKFLGALARTEFMLKDRFEIPRKEFDTFLDQYSDKYGFNRAQISEFVAEIERCGVLNMSLNVEFGHRSFLDYFAAYSIFDNRDEIEDFNSMFVETYFDASWSEVAFFYIGLQRRISKPLLRALFEFAEDTEARDFYKLMAGRLLQAGWYSEREAKVYGIAEALEYLAPVHRDLSEIVAASAATVPQVATDMMVMRLCEFAFRSGFLADDLTKYLEVILAHPDKSNVRTMVVLLWVLKPLIDPRKFDEATNKCLAIISNKDFAAVDEEASALTVLRILQDKNTSVAKAVTRRLNQLNRRYPDIFAKLLPSRPGFRPPRAAIAKRYNNDGSSHKKT